MAEAADSELLCLALLNIRSLTSKTEDIEGIFTAHTIHVLALTETRLDDSSEDSELDIEGFWLYRKDRNRHGGGVAFYIDNDITVKLRSDLDHGDLEMIWIEISTPDNRPVLVGCCYRTSSSKIAYLNKICRKIEVVSNEGKDIFLLGDFNIDWLKEPAEKRKIDLVSSVCGLTQIIKTSTRDTQSTSTCIDHIYTNIKEFYSILVIPQDEDISDHKLIIATLQTRVLRNTEPDPLNKHLKSLSLHSRVSHSEVCPLEFRRVKEKEVERLFTPVSAYLPQIEASSNPAPICHKLNSYIASGEFPSETRESGVFRRILEKILLQQMEEHFNKYKLFVQYQTLDNITNQWITDLKNNKKVGVLFMDFSLSSDPISPDLLIPKLETYSFSPLAISMIRSFLSHRNSSSCRWTDTHCELSRGSCMTHFLFSVYVNNLRSAHVVVSGNQLMRYCTSDDDEDLKKALRKTLEVYSRWVQKKGMVLKKFTLTMIRSPTQVKQIQTHLRSTLSVNVKEFNWIRVLRVLLHESPHLVWTS